MDEVLEGSNAVLEVLRAGRRRPKEVLLLVGRRGEKIDEIVRLAEQQGVKIRRVEWAALCVACKNSRHQGVAALAERQRYYDLEESLRECKQKEEAPLFVVLDGIEDSGNFGAILRSAECAGVEGVLVPKTRMARLGPGAAKSSAGAQEYVRIIRVGNLADALERMKREGIWIVGADAEAKDAYYDVDLREPTALVIGGEGRGLRRLTRERCDVLVGIPMRGKVGSLNAAVAAGILIFETMKQRARKR